MNYSKITRFAEILLLYITVLLLCSFNFIQFQKEIPNSPLNGKIEGDTIKVYNDEFLISELQISPSPLSEKHITFSNSEKIVDYDVSPTGINVASITASPNHIYSIKFWQIGGSEILESYTLPKGFEAKAITWHPNAKTLFVMGLKGPNYQIYRIEKINNIWVSKRIYSTQNQLRRLLVCPRPFIISYDEKTKKEYFTYRLFYGIDNGNNTFRIASITENGNRFYQVIGPADSFSKAVDLGSDIPPSEISAEWALPVAFHPGGHQLIWEDNNKIYNVANYNTKYWGDSKPLKIKIGKNGTITPTPNGLGMIHWSKDQKGIGIYLLATKREEIQLANYQFISTPSSVPDGKGIIGLTLSDGRYTLNYLPINFPLADVVNAWMFINSSDEMNLFQKNYGLFRPNQDDQLYKLYETENYNCGGYGRNTPTRPYLVTTDIFWELFGAAYQGLFIVKERDEAIPNFWKFINEANHYYKKSTTQSELSTIFTTLNDLYSNNIKNLEVLRIQNEKDCFSETINDKFSYSELKPRGHYKSSPEMAKYFKGFRYFTTIFQKDKFQRKLMELNSLPLEITSFAENWIMNYTGFISPSRSPLIWSNLKQPIPFYCKYPQKKFSIFPLSWGFDNEVLYSTVYHENLPSDIQVQGPLGFRLLPTGFDLASALGNGLAENLLESDYQKYPPLRKVINNLKINFKANSSESELKDNLYNQWINAIAIQWIDSLNSTNGIKDKDIWQTKRLQTGLATWATLRHATILVNERIAAECGEGGFEEILMRAPRGYVEPDPLTFAAIGDLFENAIKYVSKTIAKKDDIEDSNSSAKRSLYNGITERLKEAADEAHAFQSMAEKERKGENLSDGENQKILYVARTGEHLFLVFNSLSNKEYALSDPDPIAKIADVAGDGLISPYLMVAVGNTMEWNHIVPFYGRHQIVKGSIYSYFEFQSSSLLNDLEWRVKLPKQEFPLWIKPFITNQSASGIANTCY